MADLKLPRLNNVIISGRITNDIEMRYTPKGTPVVRFTLANDRSYKDEAENFQNQSYFFDVVAWTNMAEAVNNNAHKGSPVIVEGRLEQRSYVDKDNNNRKVVEIVASYIQFLEIRNRADASTTESGDDVPLPKEEPSKPHVTNDDVPF